MYKIFKRKETRADKTFTGRGGRDGTMEKSQIHLYINTEMERERKSACCNFLHFRVQWKSWKRGKRRETTSARAVHTSETSNLFCVCVSGLLHMFFLFGTIFYFFLPTDRQPRRRRRPIKIPPLTHAFHGDNQKMAIARKILCLYYSLYRNFYILG